MVLLHEVASPKPCSLLPHRCTLHRGLPQAGSSPQAHTSGPHAHSLEVRQERSQVGEASGWQQCQVEGASTLQLLSPSLGLGTAQEGRLLLLSPGAPSHPPLPPSPAGRCSPPTQGSLPLQFPSTRTWRTAGTGLLLGLAAGADTLDLRAGDGALVAHAGRAGTVGRHPDATFRVLLSVSEAACVPGRQI